MAHIITAPSVIKVVPRDGELEITLNININLEGQVTAMAVGNTAHVETQTVKKIADSDDVQPLIPDFSSGPKLSFGKKS